MEFPTFAETLTNMHKIIFKTTDMANPTWGFTRNQVSNPASNFDASDSNVFTLYDVWTE